MEVVHVHLAHAARPERLVRADRAPEGLRARVDPHVRLQTGLKDLQSVAQKLHRVRELAPTSNTILSGCTNYLRSLQSPSNLMG